MSFIPIFISLGGVALCAMALVQLALWSTQSLVLISQNKKQFELSRKLLQKQIQSIQSIRAAPASSSGHWNGFRSFRVAKLVKETTVCTSVYLQPEDGKPIPDFKPGQHLTFKFQIPGEPKPVVRCYSLSDRPHQDFYRISVKSVAPPLDNPEFAPGKASHFINHSLMVGDRIDVKAPSGHFVLDQTTDSPIILLGGGIGITPLISMVNHLLATDCDRLILLVYGIRNSSDHAFKSHLDKLNAQHQNFHLVNCYSNPEPTDVEGTDFHLAGFASADLLKKILPDNRCQFYLCGPPPFMESIHNGLLDWGVPEARIFFEAFGPASIGNKTKSNETKYATFNDVAVKFVASHVETTWNSGCESVLELAEACDVTIDSGCRAGSCGTCATGLLKGKVSYPENQVVDCEPGQCLVCIAQPEGPIELDV